MWLFNHVAQAMQPWRRRSTRLQLHHPVPRELLAWHANHGEHAPAETLLRLDELAQTRPLWMIYQVIAQQHAKRLDADDILGHQHRMSQAQWALLTHEAQSR